MAIERTAMLPDGSIVFLDKNKDAMLPNGSVISEQLISVPVSGFQAAWALNRTATIGTR